MLYKVCVRVETCLSWLHKHLGWGLEGYFEEPLGGLLQSLRICALNLAGVLVSKRRFGFCWLSKTLYAVADACEGALRILRQILRCSRAWKHKLS